MSKKRYMKHIQTYRIHESTLSPINNLMSAYTKVTEPIENIGTIYDVKVLAVDRNRISHKYPQWKSYIGSHHWGKGTSYIPEDSIWIAQGLSQEEFVRVVNHELIERKAMQDLQSQGMTPGESWNIAHPTIKTMGF